MTLVELPDRKQSGDKGSGVLEVDCFETWHLWNLASPDLSLSGT